MKIDIVVISDIHWNFMFQRHQQFATMFVNDGYKCLFINRVGTMPYTFFFTIGNLYKLLKAYFNSSKLSHKNLIPNGLWLVDLPLLPRGGIFDMLKMNILSKKLVGYNLKGAIVIHYSPQSTFFKFFQRLGAGRQYFDCVHLFSAHKYWRGYENEYRQFLNSVDMTFYDSEKIGNDIQKTTARSKHLPPGVSEDFFIQDGVPGQSKALFFGHLRDDTDLESLIKLSKRLSIDFVGISSLSYPIENIFKKIMKPVPRGDLPSLIADYAYLVLPYRNNIFQSGIIPAKIYECLATGRIVLYSGLNLNEELSECMIHIDDFMSNRLIDAQAVVGKARKIAALNKWGARYDILKNEMVL